MLLNKLVQLHHHAIYHLVCLLCTLYLGLSQADGSNSPPSSTNNNSNNNNNSNQYLIKFIHNDARNNVTYMGLLQVTPAPSKQLDFRSEFHIELKYQSKHPFVTIDERAPNNTVVAAIVVGGINEDDIASGKVSLSIDRGNELNHFKLVITPFTNTIQVNGAPLSKQLVPEYNLTIVVKEHGPTATRSSSTNLVIKLHTSLPPPGSSLPSEPLQGSKPPVTDLMYVGAMLVVIFSALIFLMIIGCALVQRPKSKKSPPPRATSSATSRIHPSEHCLCLGLTNL